MNLHDGFALARRKVPHLLRHGNKISNVHRLQLAFVETLSHSDKKSPLQHRHIFIRRMPMRRNLRAVSAPDAQNERLAFCIHVSRYGRKIASLYDRRPFQILPEALTRMA